MAERPVFLATQTGSELVRLSYVQFLWNAGLSRSQKLKNIRALHAAAVETGLGQVLEVSTKSDQAIGQRLSAFNLEVKLPDGRAVTVESAYQGSKVFERGGPLTDLYLQDSLRAKRDPRLKELGALVGFDFFGEKWSLHPATAFYDWLFLGAVHRSADLGRRLLDYAAFSDIEFNPARSVSCQAGSCALYVALARRELIGKVLQSREAFIQTVSAGTSSASERRDVQGGLFGEAVERVGTGRALAGRMRVRPRKAK